jgi:hypothetical protein
MANRTKPRHTTTAYPSPVEGDRVDRLRPFFHHNSIDSRPAASAEYLLMIDAPHFCCGVVFRENQVIRAAPIVHYMRGWNADRLKRYCAKRGWRVEAVSLNGGHDETNGGSHFDDAHGDGG